MMENIYLIIVFILFLLAVSDLVVGVSNDAVNFLNSAVGSKAAPYRVILFVASMGVFLGAMFSMGMMEVARNGIFNPQYFYFAEIMVIFTAVMITDVILLDAFNSLGLPTSTTVSLVSELMGAAVAISLIKLSGGGQVFVENGIERLANLGDYINTAKSLGIITGILSSVVIAFTAGIIVQFLARLLFSFDFVGKMKYFGALWGGIAVTSITYFLLVKGAKDSVFMNDNAKSWVNDNGNLIILYSLVGWTVLLQLFRFVFSIDILKFTVLLGTFALAWAFAGNDLVNFVGVPIAGFNAFEFFSATPGANADTFLMTDLGANKPVVVPVYMLIMAGGIMVLTLWFSRNARNVTRTELSLSNQNEGEERFGSSFLARNIVRAFVKISESFDKRIPNSVKRFVDKRFDASAISAETSKATGEKPKFDLIRASVNLVTSSILISIATSHKLPLSTTYVTFMVAMGSSLADRSWGRESAVYRVTGVLSVIAGWFFTAFSAFTGAFVFALLIYWLGVYGAIGLVLLAFYAMYHTYVRSKRQEATELALKDYEIEEVDGDVLPGRILDNCRSNVVGVLNQVATLYDQSLVCFEAEDRKGLKSITRDVVTLNTKTKTLRHNIYPTVRRLQEESIDTSLYYVQVVDYLRETAHCLSYIANPCFDHIDNNHKVFSDDQFEDLKSLRGQMQLFVKESVHIISENAFNGLEIQLHRQQQLLEHLKLLRKKQLKRIKKEKEGTRISLLYLNILHETQNMLLHMGNLLKAQRDFVAFQLK
jgi:phosphate/sulfate permease